MTSAYNISAIRREFAVVDRMLYLDSGHQTPLSTGVRAALMGFYDESYETAGPKAVWLRRVEKTRARVAKLLGAASEEIAFTKNTSEGLNIAANAIPFERGDVVLMVEGDHPNNAYAFLNLRRKGVEVRFIALPGDDVIANADTFAPHIDERTRAISLSHVTFHAGQRFDIAGIGALCQKHGTHLVVDAMQSIGVLPLNVKAMGVSILAAGTHKGLLVPQGLGILYVDSALEGLEPAYIAAASLAEPPADYIARPNEMGLAAGAGRFELGNFNLPGIHALSAALDLIARIGVQEIEKHVLDLGDHLISKMDELGVALIGPRHRAQRSHIYVLDLQDDWADYLAKENVRVSPERGGIRISLAMFNTVDDIDQLAMIIGHRLAKPFETEDSNEPIMT